MKHTDNAIKLIKSTRVFYNSCTVSSYNGYTYIGYSQMIRLQENELKTIFSTGSKKLSKSKAEEMLRNSLDKIDKSLSKYLDKDLSITQNQYDAICSLVYDIGIKAFVTSELYLEIVKPTKDRDILKISSMFRRYNKYKKTPIYRLIKTREKEMELFLKKEE